MQFKMQVLFGFAGFSYFLEPEKAGLGGAWGVVGLARFSFITIGLQNLSVASTFFPISADKSTRLEYFGDEYCCYFFSLSQFSASTQNLLFLIDVDMTRFRIRWHCSFSVNNLTDQLLYPSLCIICNTPQSSHLPFWALQVLHHIHLQFHLHHPHIANILPPKALQLAY